MLIIKVRKVETVKASIKKYKMKQIKKLFY